MRNSVRACFVATSIFLFSSFSNADNPATEGQLENQDKSIASEKPRSQNADSANSVENSLAHPAPAEEPDSPLINSTTEVDNTTEQKDSAESEKTGQNVAREPINNVSSEIVDNKTPEPFPKQCQPGLWSLKGADYKSKDGKEKDDLGIVFNTEWIPVLNQISECMQLPESKNACLEVQGRFDDIKFSPAIVQAFGSVEAAQSARGMGRAAIVIRHLYDMQVPIQQMRDIPPPMTPSYRGVEVTYVPICSARAEGGDTNIQYIIMPQGQNTKTEVPKKEKKKKKREWDWKTRPDQLQLWAEFGLYFTLNGSNPDTVPALEPANLGVGLQNEHFYGRWNASISYGFKDGQRFGWGTSVAGGFIPLTWLHVGIVAGYKMSTYKFAYPWMEQELYVGFEATEYLEKLKLWKGATLGFRQSFSPFGARIWQAEMQGNNVLSYDKKSKWMINFEIGIFLRQTFDLSSSAKNKSNKK